MSILSKDFKVGNRSVLPGHLGSAIKRPLLQFGPQRRIGKNLSHGANEFLVGARE
jgi:hypothetical protein